MYDLFGGADHPLNFTLGALGEAVVRHDTSQVPVIIELMLFFPSAEFLTEGDKALSSLTGEEIGPSAKLWTKWLGPNLADYQPPERYLDWKINLFSLLDPRFADLLAPAAEGARIDMTEVAWGGVRLDGITPLEHAPAIAAEEQNYLNPDDRVFGVSINGEHRAYPLRIMNAHEMANDTLGGEPISLAY